MKRANLTTNIPFLKGYQGNTCFYSGEEIHGTPNVDRMPRQVILHDQIWNLVLAHEECNLQSQTKLLGRTSSKNWFIEMKISCQIIHGKGKLQT